MPVVLALSFLLAGCAQARRSTDGGAGGPTASHRAAPERTGRFLVRAVEVGGARHAYQVYVPAVVGPDSPVILFLHGSGERGDDNQRQVEVGLGPHIRSHPDFPAIAVFPQSPEGRSWDGDVAAAALAALEASMRELGGDPRRVYLTGLSRGGYGVWEMAFASPDRFAALVPICAGVRPPAPGRDIQVSAVASEPDPHAVLAARLRAVPTWIFHGALDDVVPPADSRRMADALRAAGGDVRLTVFPAANHNSWDPAYADPALWPWLFAQRRP
jgi:predicted peptidase